MIPTALRHWVTRHPLRFLAAELILGFMVSLLALALFIQIRSEVVLEREFTGIDQTLSYVVYSWRTPLLTISMYVFSLLGQQLVIAASGLVTVIFWRKKHRREAFLFLTMLIGCGLLDYILKTWIARPRPTFAPMYTLSNYSFPSGHSMTAFVFYAMLAYFFYHFTKDAWKTVWVSLGAVIMIICVGISRVYLGVHYPSDVLAGYIAGFWWFSTVVFVDKSMRVFHLFTQKIDGKRRTR